MGHSRLRQQCLLHLLFFVCSTCEPNLALPLRSASISSRISLHSAGPNVVSSSHSSGHRRSVGFLSLPPAVTTQLPTGCPYGSSQNTLKGTKQSARLLTSSSHGFLRNHSLSENSSSCLNHPGGTRLMFKIKLETPAGNRNPLYEKRLIQMVRCQ